VNFMTFDAIQDLLKDLRDTAEIEIIADTATETATPETIENE